MMNDHLFSFQRFPFATYPDPSTFYPAETAEAARQTVLHVLQQEIGIPLIFGAPGTGKSLLLRVLKQQLENDNHVVYVANARLRAPKALYQHLLFAVHQSYCGMHENELRLLFLDYLRQEDSRPLVLLIDEAHSLTRSVLEELRVLLHCNENSGPHIRLALAGTHQFEEQLTHPHLDAFQQQVVTRSYLEKFRWDETSEEILWQLHHAGCQSPDSLFLPEARKAVHKLTEGLPRIVHQLCRQAVDCAIDADASCIDEQLVQKAWAQLQQLPGCETPSRRAGGTPVIANRPTATVARPNVLRNDSSPLIEFGTLDDDESEIRETNVFEIKAPQINSEANLVPETDEPEDHMTNVPSEECADSIYRLPTFSDELPSFDEEWSQNENEESEADYVCEWDTLDEALSDKNVTVVKTQPPREGESCQKLLDELSVMEHLLTQEITVINRMKQIENDCLSRRVRHVSPTQILASFPEM